MPAKLKPCPFCGKHKIGIGSLILNHSESMVSCTNPNCCIYGRWWFVKKWNKRAEAAEEKFTSTNTQGKQALREISALVENTIESLRRGCGPNMWDFLEQLQKLLTL